MKEKRKRKKEGKKERIGLRPLKALIQP